MMEGIVIGLLFIAALAYLGRKLYLSVRVEKGCSKGCGCSEAEIKKAIKDARPG